MRFSGISPFTPIFTRELRSLSRRRRTYLLRMGYLGFFTLILLGVWENNRVSPGRTPDVISVIQTQNEIGQSLFAAFSMFNIILLGSIGPLLTCTAINSERLANTLHVLLMTPLTSWQIVIGKLSSRLMAAAMLLIISTPVLAVIRLLGGVELSQIIHTILFAGAVVFCGASVGLLFSSLTTRPYTSIIFSYGFFAILYIAVPILVFAVGTTWWPRLIQGPEFLQWHPFLTTMSIHEDQVQFSFWPGFALQLGLGLVAMVLTTLQIRRRESVKRQSASHTARSGPTPVALAASDDAKISSVLPNQSIARPAMPALEYASAATPIASRDVGDNPVLWRELRRDLFHRRSTVRWVVLTIFAFTLLLLYSSLWKTLLRDEDLHAIALNLAQGGVLLIVGMITASSVANEKESDTWPLIVSTPLGGREIVYGKILGMMSRLMLPTALVLIHLLVFTIVGPLDWLASIVVVLTLAGFVLPWIPLGLFLSLRLNKTTTAVVATLSLQLLTYAGLPAGLALGADLFNLDDDLSSIAYAIEPFYYLSASITRFYSGFSGTISMFDIWGCEISKAMWFGIFLKFLLIHIALAWLGIRLIIRNFDRIVARAPQVRC